MASSNLAIPGNLIFNGMTGSPATIQTSPRYLGHQQPQQHQQHQQLPQYQFAQHNQPYRQMQPAQQPMQVQSRQAVQGGYPMSSPIVAQPGTMPTLPSQSISSPRSTPGPVSRLPVDSAVAGSQVLAHPFGGASLPLASALGAQVVSSPATTAWRSVAATPGTAPVQVGVSQTTPRSVAPTTSVVTFANEASIVHVEIESDVSSEESQCLTPTAQSAPDSFDDYVAEDRQNMNTSGSDAHVDAQAHHPTDCSADANVVDTVDASSYAEKNEAPTAETLQIARKTSETLLAVAACGGSPALEAVVVELQKALTDLKMEFGAQRDQQDKLRTQQQRQSLDAVKAALALDIEGVRGGMLQELTAVRDQLSKDATDLRNQQRHDRDTLKASLSLEVASVGDGLNSDIAEVASKTSADVVALQVMYTHAHEKLTASLAADSAERTLMMETFMKVQNEVVSLRERTEEQSAEVQAAKDQVSCMEVASASVWEQLRQKVNNMDGAVRADITAMSENIQAHLKTLDTRTSRLREDHETYTINFRGELDELRGLNDQGVEGVGRRLTDRIEALEKLQTAQSGSLDGLWSVLTKHAEALGNRQSSFEEEVGEKSRKEVEQRGADWADMKAKLARDLEGFKNDVAQQLHTFSSENSRAVGELRAQALCEDDISTFRADMVEQEAKRHRFAQDLEALKKQQENLSGMLVSSVEELRTQDIAMMKKLQDERHSNDIMAMQLMHQEALTALQQQFAQEYDSHRQLTAEESDALSKKVACEVEALRTQHADFAEAVQRQHSCDMDAVRGQCQKCASDVDALRTQQRSEAKLMRGQYTSAIETSQGAFRSELDSLQDHLSEDIDKLRKSQQSFSETIQRQHTCEIDALRYELTQVISDSVVKATRPDFRSLNSPASVASGIGGSVTNSLMSPPTKAPHSPLTTLLTPRSPASGTVRSFGTLAAVRSTYPDCLLATPRAQTRDVISAASVSKASVVEAADLEEDGSSHTDKQEMHEVRAA